MAPTKQTACKSTGGNVPNFSLIGLWVGIVSLASTWLYKRNPRFVTDLTAIVMPDAYNQKIAGWMVTFFTVIIFPAIFYYCAQLVQSNSVAVAKVEKADKVVEAAKLFQPSSALRQSIHALERNHATFVKNYDEDLAKLNVVSSNTAIQSEKLQKQYNEMFQEKHNLMAKCNEALIKEFSELAE